MKSAGAGSTAKVISVKTAYGTLDLAEAGRENVAFVPYEALSDDSAVWQVIARPLALRGSICQISA